MNISDIKIASKDIVFLSETLLENEITVPNDLKGFKVIKTFAVRESRFAGLLEA